MRININEALVNAKLPKVSVRECAGGFEIEFKQILKTNPAKHVVENVTENQQLILRLLTQNNKRTAKQLAATLEVTERTVQRHLNLLQQQHKIKRIGPAKSGYWEIQSE